ncbi:MAG: response regulator transcription factor [Acidobacteriota bacterium]|nr:MAG: response regulator transcription factor [Acidobacteriota bacterium]
MARILIVEDDADLAFGLSDDLQVEGYSVEVVSDGEAALERVREEQWDLILLDVMLPRKDGFEVCRELRRSGGREPIIILTAKTQEAEKVLGLELGADDYITKPFSPRELRARVKAVLRRSKAETPEIFRFANVEVDFTRGEIRRSGTKVEVTPLELKLLEVFINNRGRVLSRDRLLDAAWGSDTFVIDRAVDAHIVNLRRKIEPEPEKPCYLITVRGMGYRFDG